MRTSRVLGGSASAIVILNVAFLPMADERPSVNAYLETIALGTLSQAGRAEFVATVLRRVWVTGVDAVMVADTGYADLAVFRALGFRAAPRRLRLLLGALRPGVLGSVPTTVGPFAWMCTEVALCMPARRASARRCSGSLAR